MKKHRIHALFPILLFLIVTLFALFLIVLSAKIYKNTTENSHLNHQARIALSYVSEKLHQQEDCPVTLSSYDGIDALMITQTYGESRYDTYVYYYDGAIRELFIKENTKASLSDGKPILEVLDFSMEQITEDLFYYTCTDSKNQNADSYVSISH